MAGFLLRDEDVTIDELDSANPILPRILGISDCPSNTAPFGFDWIEKMPKGSDIMKKVNFERTTKDVMATLDICDGELFTYRFPADFSRKRTLKWYFDKAAGGGAVKDPRAISEVIKFFRDLSAATNITFSSSQGKVILEPDGNGVLEAWVLNLPLIDIFIDRSSTTQDRGPEFHFSHLHALSTAPADLIPWPVKADWCPGNPTGGSANPRCPPVLFTDIK
jgi:hypothetical protein